MHTFLLLCLVVLAVSGQSSEYKHYPSSLTLPITFYDYQEWSAFINDDGKKRYDEATTDEKLLLCDFNICSGTRSPYCNTHKHQDNESGKVASTLNKDGFPYIPAGVSAVSYKRPELWFSPNKWSKQINSTITLKKVQQSDTVPVYKFNQTGTWRPINCDGWNKPKDGETCDPTDTEGTRNSVFATHFTAKIIYTRDLSTITIASDDDSWLFINRELAIDYGGTRAPKSQTFTITSDNFVEGKEYQVDFFHADRCATNAAFTIVGPLTCDTVAENGKDDDDGDGFKNCMDGCPENPYLSEKVEDKCVLQKCSNIPTERMCNAINNDIDYNPVVNGSRKFHCSWCGGINTCVDYKDTTACPCNKVTENNADVCTEFEEGRCKFCKSITGTVESCQAPTDCQCEYFENIEACHNAKAGCVWCGSKCISNLKECPDCETFKTKDECVSVDTLNNKEITSKCVWCKNGDAPGSCQSECKCDISLNDETKCEGSVTVSSRDSSRDSPKYSDETKTRFSSAENNEFCKICGDANYRFCAEKDADCTACYLNTNKENCEAEGCKWCGDSIGCRMNTCPECESLMGKDKCENALDESADDPNDKCSFCDIGTCTKHQDCKTCDDINKDTGLEKIVKESLVLDSSTQKYTGFKDDLTDLKNKITEIKNNCKVHYAPGTEGKLCAVCINDFFVKIYSNGTIEVPPICAPADSSSCWKCEDLNIPIPDASSPSDDNDEDFDTVAAVTREDAPSASKEDNEFIILTLSDDDAGTASACGSIINANGEATCGYCPLKEQCQSLTSDEITEYNSLTTSAKRKDFIFHLCDTDCTLYGTDFNSCTKSALNCTWCIEDTVNATDGFACGPQDRECKACGGFTSSLQCTASGCRWCSASHQCITRNRPCPEGIAAIGIGAGVVAGIVVAAVAAVAISSFASKKVYDAILEAREVSMDSATSNPLFEGKEDGGVNPTFEPTGDE